MKSLFYPEFGRLCITDVPPPTPEPDAVIVRVAACGICGSEIETFKKRSPRRQPPLVMGHEFCGHVVETGTEAHRFVVGAPVIAHSLVHCGQCPACRRGDTHLCSARQIFGMDRAGAFAEFVAVPERCLIAWPQDLAAASAAFTEPLANGVHIVNLTKHRPADNALVIGAGPIGLMCHLALAALRQSRVFALDTNPARLEMARQLGAQVPPGVNPDTVREWLHAETGAVGLDLVIDAVGSAATKQQSLQFVRPGGGVVWIGLHEDAVPLNSYGVTLREVQIYGTYAATMAELETAADLLARGRVRVDALVDAYPLPEGVRAFEQACAGRNIKSVLLAS